MRIQFFRTLALVSCISVASMGLAGCLVDDPFSNPNSNSSANTNNNAQESAFGVPLPEENYNASVMCPSPQVEIKYSAGRVILVDTGGTYRGEWGQLDEYNHYSLYGYDPRGYAMECASDFIEQAFDPICLTFIDGGRARLQGEAHNACLEYYESSETIVNAKLRNCKTRDCSQGF